jgi:chromosome segregation ATPase
VFLDLIAGVRQYVGARKRILSALHRLEHQMASAAEQLNLLNDKVSDIRADFDAFKTAVETGNSTLDAAAQEAYDRLAANLGGLDTAVGDADGSDGPTEPLPSV